MLHFTPVKLDHPKMAEIENEILSLSWCISKSFCQISVVELSKSNSVNKYLECNKILTMRQNEAK